MSHGEFTPTIPLPPEMQEHSALDPFDYSRGPASHEINAGLFGPEQLTSPPGQAELDQKYPDHLIASKEIVSEFAEKQTGRAAWLQELGATPVLEVFICGKNYDNESYLAQAKAYGARIGVNVVAKRYGSLEAVDPKEPITEAELKMMSGIAAAKRNGQYRGRLVLGPAETKEGWRWIQAASGDQEPDDGDLDGVGGFIPSDKEGRVATTSEAMVLYAEMLLGDKLERVARGQIGVVGNGGVGGPLRERILRKRGINPGLVLATRTQVESADALLEGHPQRVIFGTARANGVLTGRNITPPPLDSLNFPGKTLIIDAGNAPHPETGVSGGNTDTTTLKGSNVYATPFIGGVGPVTVALLFERLLDKAEQDYYTEQAELFRQNGWLAKAKAWVQQRRNTAPPTEEKPRPPIDDRSDELVGAGV